MKVDDMNKLKEMEFIEVCYYHLYPDKKSTFISPHMIASKLSYPLSYYEVKKKIEKIYPIYKNNRIRKRYLKISRKYTDYYVTSEGIFLRPIEHSKQSIERRKFHENI